MWLYNVMNDYNTKVTLELGEMVKSGVNIWDFDYPSYYSGEEKKAFEQKVIDHFYFRQIGMETPGRWLHFFRSRIREIMPYYLQMYKSVEIMAEIEDPFESYNLREEFTQDKSGSGTVKNEHTDESTVTTSGTGERTSSQDNTTTDQKNGSVDFTKKFSNTPQGSIDNLDRYLTEGSKENTQNTENNTSTVNAQETVNDQSSGNSTGSASGTNETTTTDQDQTTYTLTRKGNIGVQPLGNEITALRNSFINVDMMIIGELNDLFLKVY